MPLLSIDLFVDQYTDLSFIYPAWLAGGVPVSFVGASATLMVRATPSDVIPLVAISTTPSLQGSIVLGPVTLGPTGSVPAGCVQVNISHTQTALLTVPLAAYDLTIAWGGIVTEFATGYVRTKPGNAH